MMPGILIILIAHIIVAVRWMLIKILSLLIIILYAKTNKWAEIKGFQPTEHYYIIFMVKFHCVEFGRPACGAL